jgi:HEAT repeat protein
MCGNGRMRRRLQLIAAAALALRAAPATAAEPTPAPTPAAAVALAADGRYAEAYAALNAGDGAHDPQALHDLAEATLVHGIDSPDVFERWAALRAGRALRDPALAGPAFRQLAGDGRYEQALALEILANVAPEASRGAFLTALDSPHRTIRLRALRALHDAPRRAELIPRVAVLVTDDPDPDVRVVAVHTLRDWYATGTLVALRRAVGDPAPVVRREAVAALVVFGDPELSNIVRQRLAEAPGEDRASALRLAGLVPSRTLLPAIGPFLSDSDPEVRTAAAAAVLSITAAETALP